MPDHSLNPATRADVLFAIGYALRFTSTRACTTAQTHKGPSLPKIGKAGAKEGTGARGYGLISTSPTRWLVPEMW